MIRRGSSSWSPAEAASSLAGLAFLERALAHILAGWAVKMPAFEAKLVFATPSFSRSGIGLHLRRRPESSSTFVCAGGRVMD